MHYQSHIERIGTSESVTGTLGAAQMAAAAGVRRLILVHVEEQFATSPFTERGVADISEIYDGDVIFARELMELDLT
jgi:ribonuclease BN (tRNA processing enzyme)